MLFDKYFYINYNFVGGLKFMDEFTKQKYKKHRKIGTTITFNAEELAALAKYVSAGMVLLQTSHPVISRLKAALTRVGLPTPKGL